MLTPTETTMLNLASYTWHSRGAEEQAIREHLDMSRAQFYFKLAALVDRVDALEHDPVLVRRLRRRRDSV